MANKILVKRSSTAGSTPTTTEIESGEFAINSSDGRVFIKQTQNGTDTVLAIQAQETIELAAATFDDIGGGTLIAGLSDGTLDAVGTNATITTSTSLTAGIIWDNHSTSTAYDYNNNGTDATTSATAATDITVVNDKTLLLTHAEDAGELRSVYVEKKVIIPATPTPTKKIAIVSSLASGAYANAFGCLRFLTDAALTTEWEVGTRTDTSITASSFSNGVSITATSAHSFAFEVGYVLDMNSDAISFGWPSQLFTPTSLGVTDGYWHVGQDGSGNNLTTDQTITITFDTPLTLYGISVVTNPDTSYHSGSSGRGADLAIQFLDQSLSEIGTLSVPEQTAVATPSSYDADIDTPAASNYWQLESFDDWDVRFASSTTTKLINKTAADAVIRARITAPTASGSGSGTTTDLTAGIIWDNHSTSTGYDYDNDGTAGTTSASAATDITVVDDKTLLLTHVADAGELRSVYVEKFIPADSGLEGTAVAPTITTTMAYSTSVKKHNASSLDFTGGGYLTFSSVALTNTFSIDLWIYLPSSPASLDALIEYGYYTGGVNGFILYIYSSMALTFLQSQGTQYQYTTVATLSTSTWHHIRLSKTGGDYYVFVDGVLESTISSTADITSSYALDVGARGGTAYKFPGYIDSLRVDNVGRTTAFTPETAVRSLSADPIFTIESDSSDSTFSAYSYAATGVAIPAYWQLESFDDWNVQFASSTTTKLINKTAADAVIRARITAPTASGSGSGSSTLADLTDSTTATTDPLITSNQAVGHLWINSTSGEAYVCTDATTDENVWTNIGVGSGDIRPSVPLSATGGTVDTYSIGGVSYKSHTFLTSGSFVVTESGTVGTVDILVVGGGGAGAYNNWVGGGGGGGGVETSIAYSVTAATYTATVGAGGARFTSGAYGGNDGADSVFATSANTTIVSGLGGNKPDGEASCNPSGNDYTCGATTGANYIGGGGGGAGAAGADGVGGAGIESLFRSGTSAFYGGGGGGGVSNGNSAQSGGSGGGGDSLQNGDVNTGGGGGGGSKHALNYAGSGGSGIVIVRYAT